MSDPAAEPLYKILDGVHRSVAAHMVGLTEIATRIDVDGFLGPVQLLPLRNLLSPKPTIDRWDRGRDFHVLLQLMADETEREKISPIEVAAIPEVIAKYFTPVANVVVTSI